jgi:outer membrane protein insertion porin family
LSRLPHFDSVRHAISLARWCALVGWCALSLSGCCGWGTPLANNAANDSTSRAIARKDRSPRKFDPYQLPGRAPDDNSEVTIERSEPDRVDRNNDVVLANHQEPTEEEFAAQESATNERPRFEQEGDYGSRTLRTAPAPQLASNPPQTSAAKSLGYSDKALRGQSPSGGGLYTPGTTSPNYGGNVRPPPSYAPGSGDAYQRQPMGASGAYGSQSQVQAQPSIYGSQGAPPSPYNANPSSGSGYEPAEYSSERPRVAYQNGGQPVGAPIDPTSPDGGYPRMGPPPIGGGGYYETFPPNNVTPLDVFVSEGRTGKITFGVGVNSNAGVNGNITIDERNFDLFNPPKSWDDWINGTAFRGAGQGFRIEAMPGSQVSRYLVSLTEPYLFGTDISSSNSAYYFQRYYFDWAEQRIGGRSALGYRLSPDLSASGSLRYEDVKIFSPRIAGVAPLDAVLGSNDLATGMVSLTHDTRDNAFFATQGNYISLSYEQAFGQYSFPRGEVDARQHIRLYERPDGSGAHVLSLYGNLGVSGSDTPLFENYFIGGYGSLRGWQFRGVGPLDKTVRLGGRFKALGTAEYTVPVTADDMVRLAFFVDAGTVQDNVKFADFRLAPGVGILINVPALGPAPLALNFAFPILSEPGDSKQVFSFQMGASR